jgi:hypothetical protein
MTDARCPTCGDWDCRCPPKMPDNAKVTMSANGHKVNDPPSPALPTVDDMQDWLENVLRRAWDDGSNLYGTLDEMRHALAAWEVWRALDTIRREQP